MKKKLSERLERAKKQIALHAKRMNDYQKSVDKEEANGGDVALARIKMVSAAAVLGHCFAEALDLQYLLEILSMPLIKDTDYIKLRDAFACAMNWLENDKGELPETIPSETREYLHKALEIATFKADSILDKKRDEKAPEESQSEETT